jgi:hypothetical protein
MTKARLKQLVAQRQILAQASHILHSYDWSDVAKDVDALTDRLTNEIDFLHAKQAGK